MSTDSGQDARTDIQAVAAEAFASLGTGRQIASFCSRLPAFNLDEAYQVAAAIRRMRQNCGEMPVGRKIGFTNRTIWAEYNVFAPIWGYMYDRTVNDLAEIGEVFSLAGLSEPRIEPEIVFGLGAAPTPGMEEKTVLACIDWVAHGFEVVHSIFPGWKFAPPDTVAAFGLHGALLIGPRHSIATQSEGWIRTLSTFEIDLERDGTIVDHGCAANVLGGPVSALRHLIELLASDYVSPPLAAGEIVATGTLTHAIPVVPGETWSSEPIGVALDRICVRFV